MSKVPRPDRAAAGDGELIAQAQAAKKLRDQFERELHASTVMHEPAIIDWLGWARRLSSTLGTVLDILDGPRPAVTLPFPDGSAFLTADDVQVALTALRVATAAGEPRAVLFRSLTRRLGGAS